MADETFTKADLDKAVKDAIEDATKGLKENLTAALDEAKDAKRKLRAASEIKPEDVAALEAEVDTLKSKLSAAEKTAKEATTAAEKATKSLEAEQGITHKLVAENGLVTALTAAGVTDPAYLEAAKAMHIGAVKIVAEGDTRKAMFGDKDLEAAVKEWAGSEAGKKFVAAPANGGGGALGSRAKADAATMTRTAYDALDQQSKAEAGMKSAKGDLNIVEG